MIAVLAVSLWAARRELERSAISTAYERTQSAADQIALVMTQVVTRGMSEVQRLTTEPLLRRFVTAPTSELAAAIEGRLRPLTLNQPPIEIWSDDGRHLLRIASVMSGPSDVPLRETAPQAPGLHPFESADGVVYFDLVLAIPPPQGSRDAGGLLAIRRRLVAAENFNILERLVGEGAGALIGNRDGTLWTNFESTVAAPAIDATRPGPATYAAEDEWRVGSVALIEGSPWAAWVEFPLAAVLAPSRAVMVRLLLLAAGLVVVAAGVVMFLSSKLTRPLIELTEASEAIAAGEYSKRVAVRGQGEIGRLAHSFNVMADRVQASKDDLEARVAERTRELQVRIAEVAHANEELESFSYSVSHDLRSPLRHVSGFATLLDQSASTTLTDEERRYVNTIRDAASRMEQLIDDLLTFSRMARTTMSRRVVDLTNLAESARREVMNEAPGRSIDWIMEPLPQADVDPSMLHLVFVNLFSNAVKYTGPRADAKVEVGATREAREAIVFVRDNGVGFDPRYADRLFGVFQRLHRHEEFEGTGIGLANVRRIVHRHGGRVWAEGEPDKGATFFFSLPLSGA